MERLKDNDSKVAASVCKAWHAAARGAVVALPKAIKPEDISSAVKVFPGLSELIITYKDSQFGIKNAAKLSYELVAVGQAPRLERLAFVGVVSAINALAMAVMRKQPRDGRPCLGRLVELRILGTPSDDDPSGRRGDTIPATKLCELGRGLPCLRMLALDNPQLDAPSKDPAPLQHFVALRRLELICTPADSIGRLARSAPQLDHLALTGCRIRDLGIIGHPTLLRLQVCCTHFAAARVPARSCDIYVFNLMKPYLTTQTMPRFSS
jgi:hypothetical protein